MSAGAAAGASMNAPLNSTPPASPVPNNNEPEFPCYKITGGTHHLHKYGLQVNPELVNGHRGLVIMDDSGHRRGVYIPPNHTSAVAFGSDNAANCPAPFPPSSLVAWNAIPPQMLSGGRRRRETRRRISKRRKNTRKCRYISKRK